MMFNVRYFLVKPFWVYIFFILFLHWISVLVHGSDMLDFSGANCESFLSNARSVHLRRVWTLFCVCFLIQLANSTSMQEGHFKRNKSFMNIKTKGSYYEGKLLEYTGMTLFCRDGKASLEMLFVPQGTHSVVFANLCGSSLTSPDFTWYR